MLFLFKTVALCVPYVCLPLSSHRALGGRRPGARDAPCARLVTAALVGADFAGRMPLPLLHLFRLWLLLLAAGSP